MWGKRRSGKKSVSTLPSRRRAAANEREVALASAGIGEAELVYAVAHKP